ncbi:MAG: hypothetical protein NC452_03730 [Eubacterium sp.]|nr:hypothetical protein [Eubacterium sp.]
MKKMKVAALLCSAAILAGCSGNAGETAAAKADTFAETFVSARNGVSVELLGNVSTDNEPYIPKNKLGDDIINEFLSEYIDSGTEIKLMPEENAAKLDEAFKNIRINNSRFALPMMITALPQGFSAEIDYDSKSDKISEDFRFYSGDLYSDGELCAKIAVMMKDGSEEKYGIIFGITAAMSSMCKWSFGDIRYSNDTEKLNECFGEPSANAALSGALGAAAYVTANGNMIMFYDYVNGITCVSFDFENAVNNTSLAEYVPYDDFEGMPEIPEFTAESDNIDWNKVFDGDCIIIGNEKYPAVMRIGDLSEDITLFEYDIKKHHTNPDYFADSYLLMYKDRELGLIGALRKKDEKPEDAVVNFWMFMDYTKYKFPAAVMDMPLSRDFGDLLKIYPPNDENGDIHKHMGLAENNSEQYICTLISMSYTVILNVTPASVDSEAYESFLEKLNYSNPTK